MLAKVQTFLQQRKLKKDLLAFLSEMEKNLELFYVMDQRQFILNGFWADAWAPVKDTAIVRKHESIRAYANAVEQFNVLFRDYKEYEVWYASDLKNKTQDNAKKLHGMKQDLDKRLKEMEAVIIPAGQALEKEMLVLRILKNA